MPSQERKCLECGSVVHGRADKKFCSDACRVAYHNRLSTEEYRYIRAVNNILRKNRRILQQMNRGGARRIKYESLRALGFDFNHFTSTYRRRNGSRYFYCYEQGYLPIDKHWCLLVVKPDPMSLTGANGSDVRPEPGQTHS
jgi:endogenous inhibitor of DNA gyrase (YacG/DUF329 family)